jgi:hypothetical protein
MKKKILPIYFLVFLGYQFGKMFKLNTFLTEDTGESLDVLFSFSIVALIIGGGAISN